ncbi:MAG: YdcF family protein [Nitrospinae bacterium]|nr:YdcF family protein [Nitrospinota bacterium]
MSSFSWKRIIIGLITLYLTLYLSTTTYLITAGPDQQECVPVVVVLGGGGKGEREMKAMEYVDACHEVKVFLTGGRYLRNGKIDRLDYFRDIESPVIINETTNTLSEIKWIRKNLIREKNKVAIVSDLLHHRRIRFFLHKEKIGEVTLLLSSNVGFDEVIDRPYEWFVFTVRESLAFWYYFFAINIINYDS